MGLFGNIFRKRDRSSANGAKSKETVRYIRTDTKTVMGQVLTYKIHSGPSESAARKFLQRHPVNRRYLYIIVETPEGNYCRDIEMTYKE